MSDSPPWIAKESGPEAKKHAPATLRNRTAIIDVLRDTLPETGTVLEIASGSGEHAAAFAQAFPNLHWQPSDPDPECRLSIAAWANESELKNVGEPHDIDTSSEDWLIDRVDAILCINMIHISPWEATEGLMRGATRVLNEGGRLFLYGPFFRDDTQTAPSNLNFDRSLRARDPRWGLRRLDDVAAEAAKCGFTLERIVEMPANNLSIIFVKDS